MQLLYDAADLTITHDATQGWLHVTWHGVHSGWSAMACCEEILAQVRATKSTRILNDGSQDCDGWGELVGWLVADFFPRLATSGISDLAWVTPYNLQAHATVNRVIEAVTSLNATAWEDVASACAWLHQVKKRAEAAPTTLPLMS